MRIREAGQAGEREAAGDEGERPGRLSCSGLGLLEGSKVGRGGIGFERLWIADWSLKINVSRAGAVSERVELGVVEQSERSREELRKGRVMMRAGARRDFQCQAGFDRSFPVRCRSTLHIDQVEVSRVWWACVGARGLVGSYGMGVGGGWRMTDSDRRRSGSGSRSRQVKTRTGRDGQGRAGKSKQAPRVRFREAKQQRQLITDDEREGVGSSSNISQQRNELTVRPLGQAGQALGASSEAVHEILRNTGCT